MCVREKDRHTGLAQLNPLVRRIQASGGGGTWLEGRQACPRAGVMVRACAQSTCVPIVTWACVVCRMCGCVCGGVPIGSPSCLLRPVLQEILFYKVIDYILHGKEDIKVILQVSGFWEVLPGGLGWTGLRARPWRSARPLAHPRTPLTLPRATG